MQPIKESKVQKKPTIELSKPIIKLGKRCEHFFMDILKDEGFKEGVDFQDLRYVGLLDSMEKGLPDFYFPKSRTFIEIKLGDSRGSTYHNVQKDKIKELVELGYKVKTIFFDIQIRDSVSDSTKLMEFIGNLKGS